jgi:hypothetical protein
VFGGLRAREREKEFARRKKLSGASERAKTYARLLRAVSLSVCSETARRPRRVPGASLHGRRAGEDRGLGMEKKNR